MDLTTGGGCGNDACSGTLNNSCGLISNCALCRTACVNDFVGCLQVGVVENIEELGAKLEPRSLRQHRGLEEGEIPISVAGPGKSIAAKVSDSTVCRCGEGGGREELRDSGIGTAAGIESAVEIRIEVRTHGVASVTGAGGVIAKLGAKGESGLERRNGTEAPT